MGQFKFITSVLTILSCSVLVTGCGTTRPALYSSDKDQLFVEQVHKAIQCEIVYAIHVANKQASAMDPSEKDKIDFFKKWGVKYTLTLNVVEDTSFTPNLNLISRTTPIAMLESGDSVLTLNPGLTFSSKATRIETDQVFKTVEFLETQNKCEPDEHFNHPFFNNSLGIQPWLTTRLGLVKSGIFESISEKESFTYQLQFEIGKRVGVTPKWEFVRRTLKDVSPIGEGGRATSHSFLVTFGPVSKDKTRQSLSDQAEAIHTARLIGLASND